MLVGEIIKVSGCFTKEKFIAGRTLAEMEKILGFHAMRFASGITVAALLELPQINEFDVSGYTNVASHKFRLSAGLDVNVLKKNAMSTWTTMGFERLVKVRPVLQHREDLHPDVQYPPGRGVPQWIAKVPLKARIIAIVTGYPNGRYIAADAVRRS
jgi:hypothetical protein